jgi:hypothetical protein
MNDLLTDRDDLVEFRRTVNRIRSEIEYDRDYHSKSDLFDELESRLNDVVEHLDEMDSKLKEHVYAFDVTVTVTKRVYAKASDECDAEQAAMDYAVSELDCCIDWTEDDVALERREDEEDTDIYDVEV